MSFRDQKMYFEILPGYERKFTSEEKVKFKMLKKRHKDDEDLDRISMTWLKEMHTKYHLNRPKKNWDHIFQKPDEN